MNADNENLDELLKQARVPERPADYWDRFPKRVTARLSETARAGARRRAAPPLLLWSLGTAAACLAFGLSIWFWKGQPGGPVNQGPRLAEGTKIFREIEALFPNRIRSIVIEKTGVRLVLSDEANVPSSTPLLVTICRERQCRSVITFSGQQIQINGEKCDVLSDGKGNVIVVGPNLIWSSAEHGGETGPYRIDAHRLGTS